MTTRALSEFLRTAVRSRGDSAARMWFDEALTQLADDTGELVASYTKARRLGRAPLSLSAAEKNAAALLLPDVQFDHWTLEDAGRAALLLSAATARPDSFVRAATECYDQGDSAEQQSWLKSTALLPEPDQLLQSSSTPAGPTSCRYSRRSPARTRFRRAIFPSGTSTRWF
jgi:hypothetical protein